MQNQPKDPSARFNNHNDKIDLNINMKKNNIKINQQLKENLKRQPKKHFGQNFLKDQRIINKIVQAININGEIYEIGPGKGALTKYLIKLMPVIAIEIDQDCIEDLPIDDNLKIINIDVLNYNFPENADIVGNLPYNIGTKIIVKLLYQKMASGIFMLQKEVAERITGVDYSRLHILMSARYDIKKIINVTANSFWPIPKVQSQVIKLTIHNHWQDVNLLTLDEITKIMFQHPRKKLSNLKKSNSKLYDTLCKMNVDLNLRPQDLHKETYYDIARYVANLG